MVLEEYEIPIVVLIAVVVKELLKSIGFAVILKRKSSSWIFLELRLVVGTIFTIRESL